MADSSAAGKGSGRPPWPRWELRGEARGAGSSCQEAWGAARVGSPASPAPFSGPRAVSGASLMKVARRRQGAPGLSYPLGSY